MPEKPPFHDDPDAQPTEDERGEADALRAALEGAPGSNDDAALARAMRAAWAPSELSADRHERILAQALARPASPSRRGRLLRVVFGAGTAVALAAGVIAVIGSERAEEPAPEAAAPLATSRSTQPLFAQSFERHGGESSRIDRIALARQADLRENEFTRWGCAMTRTLVLAATIAAALGAMAGCSRAERRPTGRVAADAAPVDTAIMAFLSMARALHHEADLAEEGGDTAGAIEAMQRLVSAPSPRAPEVDEVLADAHARLAELHLQVHDPDRAAADVQKGLERAHAPTYFRGHLLEVGGLVEEARVHDLADAGRRAEADDARARAMQMLEEAVRVQQGTIERVLSDGGER